MTNIEQGQANALTDTEIVEVLHSFGIDTYKSKYGFPELQVSATNVPSIRLVIESCIACLNGRATATTKPVAASIDTPEFWDVVHTSHHGTGAEEDRLVAYIAHHCAAQVEQEHEVVWADAGREIDRIAKERDEARAQLAQALANSNSVEIDGIAQTLAAKTAPTDYEITKLALDNGFKLKQQPDGGLSLNPYVFEFARALLTNHAGDGKIITRDEAHAMVRTGRPAADLIREAYAFGLEQAKAAPEGWELVPKVLTPEMRSILKEVAPKWNSESTYYAMLAAAPKPPGAA